MTLYHSCDGDWENLATDTQADSNEAHKFVNYAATVLSNIGNYFVSSLRIGLDLCVSPAGLRRHHKFVPDIPKEDLTKLASTSTTANPILERIRYPMFAETPNNLGSTGPFTHYLGEGCVGSREDVATISNLMEEIFDTTGGYPTEKTQYTWKKRL